MFAAGLQRGQPLQQQRRAVARRCVGRCIGRYQRHDFRLSDGQRAGLVERDHIDAMRGLQRLGVLDQDAGARARAGAGDDRGRRGQAQRARARDHQHRHRVQQRRLPVAQRQPPAQQRDQRDRQHHRHEHRADAVDQALDRCLGRLRMLDHADDPGQHRFRADRGGTQHQPALAVDGAAGHAVVDMLGHRQAFAGQHRFVGMAVAVDHHAVDRNALARQHDHFVADAYLRQRHRGVDAVAAHARGIRPQRGQRADRVRGLPLGADLEPFAEPDQRDHHRRAFEIQMRVALAMGGGTAPDQPQRQAVGRRGAERDQQIHIAGAGARRLPARAIETPAEHELHRRGQQPLPQRRHVPGDAEPAEHHRRDQRQRQRGRDRHGPRSGPEVGGARGHGLPARRRLGHRFGGVAGAGHGLCQHRQHVGRVAANQCHKGALGRQIDLRVDHAGHRAQRAFDPAHAGGAGHLAHRQLQLGTWHRVAGGGDGVGGRRQHGGAVGLHGGLLGGQVDSDGTHARHLGQRVLDPAHAGGAGHPLDRQAPFGRGGRGIGTGGGRRQRK